MKYFYLLLVSITLTSCSTLTGTQIEAIRQFAETTQGFSTYPGKILTSIADVRYQRGLLYASSLSPDGNAEELTDLFIALKEDYKISKKADISIKIMDQYAQALLLLASDDYSSNLEKHTIAFGENLDSLANTYNTIETAKKLPVNLGNAAGKIILSGGKQYIRAKQAKYLKEYITKADTMISTICGNLVSYLKQNEIKELLDNEERGIKSDYKSFIKHKKPSPEEYHTKYNSIYIDLLSNIYATRELVTQVVNSTKKIKTTHNKLKETIGKRKKLKENISEIQSLYSDIQEIKKSIQQIKPVNK